MWSITNFIIHSTWVYLFWMGFMLFNYFLIFFFFNFFYLSFHNVFNLFVMLSPIISNNIYNAIVQESLSKINISEKEETTMVWKAWCCCTKETDIIFEGGSEQANWLVFEYFHLNSNIFLYHCPTMQKLSNRPSKMNSIK
jgi:hypothetical protein